MLPSDLTSAARDLYNAVGDSFFSDTLIWNWIQQASNEMAREAYIIEATSTQSTVAGTQTYAYPTNAIGIKRITVNGKKIKRITQREDDAITLSNQAVTASGYPIYYFDFADTIYLRPIPDAVYTMVTEYYSLQPSITSASQALLLPSLFQFNVVDYLLFRMTMKDKKADLAAVYKSEWDKHVLNAKRYKARKKRTDSFTTVQDEESLPITILGEA